MVSRYVDKQHIIKHLKESLKQMGYSEKAIEAIIKWYLC